jgi:hypothetical protein
MGGRGGARAGAGLPGVAQAAPWRPRRRGQRARRRPCGRAVVLLDDVASTGRTLLTAAQACCARRRQRGRGGDARPVRRRCRGTGCAPPACATSGAPTACRTPATASAWRRCWPTPCATGSGLIRPCPGWPPRRRGLRGGFGVAQVVAADRLQVGVEFVDQRDAVGDVQTPTMSASLMPSRYFTSARMLLPCAAITSRWPLRMAGASARASRAARAPRCPSGIRSAAPARAPASRSGCRCAGRAGRPASSTGGGVS